MYMSLLNDRGCITAHTQMQKSPSIAVQTHLGGLAGRESCVAISRARLESGTRGSGKSINGAEGMLFNNPTVEAS
jgi:hypothetical protein